MVLRRYFYQKFNRLMVPVLRLFFKIRDTARNAFLPAKQILPTLSNIERVNGSDNQATQTDDKISCYPIWVLKNCFRSST
jgi:hypothetical protein